MAFSDPHQKSLLDEASSFMAIVLGNCGHAGIGGFNVRFRLARANPAVEADWLCMALQYRVDAYPGRDKAGNLQFDRKPGRSQKTIFGYTQQTAAPASSSWNEALTRVSLTRRWSFRELSKIIIANTGE